MKKAIVEKKKKVIKEIKSFLLIIIVIFAFRSIFFEPFRIPSGSMIPTLMIGDFILVNKFAYGLKVPFSDIFLPLMENPFNPIYIIKKDPPRRGDVIVFRSPRDPSINFIKRVIGIPGDVVEIKNNVVYINEKPVEAEKIPGEDIMKDMDDKFKDIDFEFYKNKIGEHVHTTQFNIDDNYKINYPRKVVPEGHYFTMGDNRDFSYDSRFWGFVPHKYIKGEAIFVWFSMILGLGEHPYKARPWRIGTIIK
ncbi:MAG: signal peptidase I [Halobacteriovoraceae bacterium]|nr:signal peptidase I [Halobacteriovoraceae bacterium]